MNEALDRIASAISRTAGIHLRPSQLEGLRLAVRRAGDGADPEEIALRLGDGAEGAALLERIIDQVSVKETFFFRDRDQLDAIDWHDLDGHARRRGRHLVRVWDPACSTGEEAYTLALLACEAFGTSIPPVSILATDIASSALLQADAGSYRGRSARSVPAGMAQRSFLRSENGLVVGDSLRHLVRFARHNLVSDPIPPPGEERFDLIVCRNVFIYFTPETARRCVERLEEALEPHGQLVLGAADALCVLDRRLRDRSEKGASASVRTAVRRQASDSTEQAGETAPPGTDGQVEEQFLRGLEQLGSGNARVAITAFRQALYADPSFGLAAFQLARAYDTLGDATAAIAGYRRALRSLDPDDSRYDPLLEQIDVADIAAACRARIAQLA